MSKDRDFYRSVAAMLARDTTPLAMAPKARENRHKPTGRAKLREAVIEQDMRGCRHKMEDRSECGAEPHAVIPVIIWGRRSWRAFCLQHLPLHNDELRRA